MRCQTIYSLQNIDKVVEKNIEKVYQNPEIHQN